MSYLLRTRPTYIWLLLIAISIFSWIIAHVTRLDHVRFGASIVLCLAFVKVRLVILDFMEMRGAPPLMRAAFEIWVAVICAGLLLLYWRPYLI